jgi:hypothetical protein
MPDASAAKVTPYEVKLGPAAWWKVVGGHGEQRRLLPVEKLPASHGVQSAVLVLSDFDEAMP